jgi:hypothetical protein
MFPNQKQLGCHAVRFRRHQFAQLMITTSQAKHKLRSRLLRSGLTLVPYQAFQGIYFGLGAVSSGGDKYYDSPSKTGELFLKS